jgi:hypothetical protein
MEFAIKRNYFRFGDEKITKATLDAFRKHVVTSYMFANGFGGIEVTDEDKFASTMIQFGIEYDAARKKWYREIDVNMAMFYIAVFIVIALARFGN